MPDLNQSQSPISEHTTGRGFQRGEFRDGNGAECSIQQSSLATVGAVWLGLNESRDGKENTPDRMHLSLNEFLVFFKALKQFAELGQFSTEPILFQDLYGVPAALSKANNQEILFGVVLPFQADGQSTFEHTPNIYGSSECDSEVQQMFGLLAKGDTSRVDIDNRMRLNRTLAKALLPLLSEYLAFGEQNSIDRFDGC